MPSCYSSEEALGELELIGCVYMIVGEVKCAGEKYAEDLFESFEKHDLRAHFDCKLHLLAQLSS